VPDIPARKGLPNDTKTRTAPNSQAGRPNPRQIRSPSTEQEKFSSDTSTTSNKRKRGSDAPQVSTTSTKTRPDASPPQLASTMSVPYRPAQVSSSKGKGLPRGSEARARVTSPPAAKVTKNQRNAKKTTLASTRRLETIAKGQSAPEKLQSMVSSVGDEEEWSDMLPAISAISQSPAASTPQKSGGMPSTPPDTSSESSQGRNNDGGVTPRQDQLWNKLFVKPDTSQTPSQLGLQDLHLGSSPVVARPRGLVRVASDLQQATPKRKRLIDHLARPPSSSSDEDEDVDMTDAGSVAEETPKTHEMLGVTATDMAPPSSDPNDAPKSSQNSSSQPMMTTGPKITYARDRSYLTEDKLDENALLETPLEMPQEPKPGKRRGLNPYAVSQKPAPVDEFGFDEEDTTGGMRSIHELRAAGGNRRFANDMENLLDDLSHSGSSSISRRRSAMIDLCAKLTDSAFCTKVADHGFQEALFSKFASVSDPILGFSICIAVALILNVDPSAAALTQLYDSGSTETLTKMAVLDTDILRIAKERRYNMSRMAQSSVSELCRSFQQSSIWGTRKPQTMSPQIVALKSLDMLVRKLRESGHMDPVCNSDVVTELVRLTELSEESKTDLPNTDITMQELTLSILEFESLVSVASKRRIAWPLDSIAILSENLLPFLNSTDDTTDAAELLAIRLFINLTNNNEKTCDLFSKPKPVQSIVHSVTSKFSWIAEGSDESTMDRLILALGALINLAEFSDAARAAVIVDGDQQLNDLVDTFARNSRNAEQVSLFGARLSSTHVTDLITGGFS
jgi:hypothetical protein